MKSAIDSLRPVRWIAAGLAVHLLFLVSLHTGWLDLLFNDSSHTHQSFDFAVYYLAGKALLAGRDIYAVDAAFGFRYLPPFAFVFSHLFCHLSLQAGYALYLALTEALLATNLWVTWRSAPPGRRRGMAIFMWLAFSPYYLELYMGQVSFWSASLLFHLILALDRPGCRIAAASWTASVLVKPNALILAPALLRLRHVRLVAVCGLVAALASLPYFLWQEGSWSSFLARNLAPRQLEGALTHAGNLGLWGALVSLFAKLAGLPLAELAALGDLPLWGQAGVLLPLAAVVAVALAVTFRRGQVAAQPLICFWLVTYFLVYKDVWEHHYVLLMPVLVVLHLRGVLPHLRWIFALLAVPTLYWLVDVSPGTYGPIDPERTWSIATSLLYRSTKLGPVLGLWFLLARRLWTQ